MFSQSIVQQNINEKIIDRNVLAYWDGFERPLSYKEGWVMPYYRELNRLTMRGSDGKPTINVVRIGEQEQRHPGSKAYWDYLIKLHELCANAT